MIKLTRVDHRLLHGQIAFSWTADLNADCILIANDGVMKDDLRKTTLKLAKPAGCKLVIKSLDDAIKALNSGVTDKYRLLIVVESIKDAKKLIDRYPAIHSLNLGGTKSSANTRQISKAMFITDQDAKDIQELISRGIEVEIRMLPQDKKIPAKDVV